MCVHAVSVNMPASVKTGNVDADGSLFTLPGLYTFRTPIDWANMRQEQYGGSANIWWVGPPVPGAAGSPWQCMGAPGMTYAPYDYSAPSWLRW